MRQKNICVPYYLLSVPHAAPGEVFVFHKHDSQSASIRSACEVCYRESYILLPNKGYFPATEVEVMSFTLRGLCVSPGTHSITWG